jgi:SulP family sulfate permease
MIAGVTPAAVQILQRRGLADVLGKAASCRPPTGVFNALDTAVARAREWIAAQPDQRDTSL